MTEQPQGWAASQLNALSSQLPPGWEVWCLQTPYEPGSGHTWCARPQGALMGTCKADVPTELVEAIREFEADLAAHVDKARRELERTPPQAAGRRHILRAQLDAMVGLRTRRHLDLITRMRAAREQRERREQSEARG